MTRSSFSALTVLILLSISSLFSGSVQADFSPSDQSRVSLDHCDAVFEERADLREAMNAARCYMDYLRGAEGDAKLRSAAFAQALACWKWISTKSSQSDVRLEAVREGLGASKMAAREFPRSGLGPYWEAEFRLAECALKKSSAAFSLCMFSSHLSIRQSLDAADQLDPAVEGYGPTRLRGILLRDTIPGFGRDRRESESLLREALDLAPSDSRNYMEYAETLMVLSGKGAAREILLPFITSNCLTMNPRRLIECQNDQEIARAILKWNL